MTREGAGWRLYRDIARSQAHDTGGRAGCMGAWALGLWEAQAQARERGSRRGARPGRAAGPAGCALGALSLF